MLSQRRSRRETLSHHSRSKVGTKWPLFLVWSSEIYEQSYLRSRYPAKLVTLRSRYNAELVTLRSRYPAELVTLRSRAVERVPTVT